MRTWLVCKRCDVREWFQPHTKITGCPVCGSPRYAENDEGQPVIIWSKDSDPTIWEPDDNTGCISISVAAAEKPSAE